LEVKMWINVVFGYETGLSLMDICVQQKNLIF